MNADSLLIIVPARGGSQGLPRKNAKSLGGVPLLAWTFEAVKQSGLQEYQCILSTDDEEIASLGKRIGMNVPFLRPEHLATNEADAKGVLLHALEWVAQTRSRPVEYVMLLQPTSPFRPPHIISDAFQHLMENDIDAVIGVKPIYRTLGTLFYTSEKDLITPVSAQPNVITRRQEVNTLFTPNGAMYLIRAETLRKEETLFPQRAKAIEMDQICSHDIDDPADWAIAEALVDAGLTWRR